MSEYSPAPRNDVTEYPRGGGIEAIQAPPPVCPEAVKHLELATMYLWNAQAACRRQGLKGAHRLLESARCVAHHVKDLLE